MSTTRPKSRTGVARVPSIGDAVVSAGKKKALKPAASANGAKANPPLRGKAAGEPEETRKLKKKITSGVVDRAQSPVAGRQNSQARSGREPEESARVRTAGTLLQAVVKKPATRVPRKPSDESSSSSGAVDRSNPTGSSAQGSGGDLRIESVIGRVSANALKVAPRKILAPKTGPWRKILFPTPHHIDWAAPMEYALTAGSAAGGGWASFDDYEEEEPSEQALNDQEDPAMDLVGEEVYNDGMTQDEEEIALLEQAPVSVKAKFEKSRTWTTPPLCFESRFECGNLRKAIRRGETEYTLFMRDDVCSLRQGSEVPHCAQWFYFKVVNARPKVQYTISIVNFVKPESMYKEGMRPLFYSRREENFQSKGWHRVGENIQYFANKRKFTKGSNGEKMHYHSLKFTMVFPHDDDECYFAMCYPYTYTDVQRHVRELVNCPQKNRLFTRHEFCRTASGNVLDLLVISGGSKDVNKKPAILLTGRVHPGESNASFMMHGMIDYLLGPSQYASELRGSFTLYVVPMLNPDGVILGNYRCNLSGHDLNRAYPAPDMSLHPEICTVKKLARELASNGRMTLFLDMHGHSSKKGFFLYCCNESVAAFPENVERRSAFFSMGNTTFKVGKYKETTGRAVMFNEPISCVNSYTCEASFLGADLAGGSQCVHFNPAHLKGIGAQVFVYWRGCEAGMRV
jgi:hypothetical protein